MDFSFDKWSEFALLVWLATNVFELKSEVEKFLQPRINFYIRDILQRKIRMKDTEKVVASIELDDAKGFPTGQAFDQPPVWSVDDATVVSLAPAADGMSCVIAGQKPGNANVSVSGAVAGKSFAGSVAVPVVGGDAVAIKVNLGAAVPQ